MRVRPHCGWPVSPWCSRCGRGDASQAWPWGSCVRTVGCLSETWPPCRGRCQRAQPEGWGAARLSWPWTFLMGAEEMLLKWCHFHAGQSKGGIYTQNTLPFILSLTANTILGDPTGLFPHPNSICIKQSSATVIIYPNWFEDRPSFPTRHSKVAAVLSEAGEKFSPSYRNKLFKVPRRISSTAAEMFNQFTVMHCIA